MMAYCTTSLPRGQPYITSAKDTIKGGIPFTRMRSQPDNERYIYEETKPAEEGYTIPASVKKGISEHCMINSLKEPTALGSSGRSNIVSKNENVYSTYKVIVHDGEKSVGYLVRNRETGANGDSIVKIPVHVKTGIGQNYYESRASKSLIVGKKLDIAADELHWASEYARKGESPQAYEIPVDSGWKMKPFAKESAFRHSDYDSGKGSMAMVNTEFEYATSGSDSLAQKFGKPATADIYATKGHGDQVRLRSSTKENYSVTETGDVPFVSTTSSKGSAGVERAKKESKLYIESKSERKHAEGYEKKDSDSAYIKGVENNYIATRTDDAGMRRVGQQMEKGTGIYTIQSHENSTDNYDTGASRNDIYTRASQTGGKSKASIRMERGGPYVVGVVDEDLKLNKSYKSTILEDDHSSPRSSEAVKQEEEQSHAALSFLDRIREKKVSGKILGYEEAEGGHTVYTIEVNIDLREGEIDLAPLCVCGRELPSNGVFNVAKRYTEFHDLYVYLTEVLTVAGHAQLLPEFPPKSYFWRYSESIITERAEAFQRILDAVFQADILVASRKGVMAVGKFLCPHE